MKTRDIAFLGACAVALTLSMIPAAKAGLAIDFTGPTRDFNNDKWSQGFEFDVDTPFLVQSLGFYDDKKNNLTESHDVGIWDVSGNLLVSGRVDPGDWLNSWFRWTNVTPTLLAVGSGYRIAAVTSSENYTWDPTGFTTDPAITFVTGRYTLSSTLVYPASISNFTGLFGPNFSNLLVPPIPEPASLALLGIGLAGLGFVRRRRT